MTRERYLPFYSKKEDEKEKVEKHVHTLPVTSRRLSCHGDSSLAESCPLALRGSAIPRFHAYPPPSPFFPPLWQTFISWHLFIATFKLRKAREFWRAGFLMKGIAKSAQRAPLNQISHDLFEIFRFKSKRVNRDNPVETTDLHSLAGSDGLLGKAHL